MTPETTMDISNKSARTRVLLVDDEQPQLESRGQVLKMCGFSVLTACGPIEALSEMSANTEIDVAVLDYNMPVMNGCALADRLRSSFPKLKIILHSGSFDIPRREMTSVDAFVPKGDGVASLIARIEDFASVPRPCRHVMDIGNGACFDTGSGAC